jgi:hypothetical protein
MIGLYVGRKLGWGISKMFLYTLPTVAAVFACLVWGFSIAYGLRAAIDWLQPGLILKVLGFGAGAYVANPSYGLFIEQTIPPEQLGRHYLVSLLPLLVFIVTSVMLALVR